jgi:ketosteroid isomerase-like protein
VDQKTDADFSWTDRAGKTHSKSETLAGLNGLAGEEDSDVQVIGKGPIVLVRGIHRIPAQNASVRFVRAWIQHSAGWRLMVYQETTKAQKNPEKRSGFGAPSGGATVTCENPCNTMPYHPETAGEKEVADMWQAVERTVLTNDVEAWIPNFTDDFIFVTPDGGDPLNKADRVTMIKQLKSTNTTLIPAEVESMKIWVEGNSALMRSEHKPRHGKMLHVTRLFVKDNGHWQIAFGQQTAIE